MVKHLLIYLSDIDFESLENIDGYDDLNQMFDRVHLEEFQEENFKGAKTWFKDRIVEISNSRDDFFLQIIAHGNADGLALRKPLITGKRIGTKETLISFEDLNLHLKNSLNNGCSLNLITVCYSDNPNLINSKFNFLATCVNESNDDEGLKTSIKILENIREGKELDTGIANKNYVFY